MFSLGLQKREARTYGRRKSYTAESKIMLFKGHQKTRVHLSSVSKMRQISFLEEEHFSNLSCLSYEESAN